MILGARQTVIITAKQKSGNTTNRRVGSMADSFIAIFGMGYLLGVVSTLIVVGVVMWRN